MNAEYKKNTKQMEDFYSWTKVNKNHETKKWSYTSYRQVWRQIFDRLTKILIS